MRSSGRNSTVQSTVICNDGFVHHQERKRVLAHYPATPSLQDNEAIAVLIKTARDKGRGPSDDPYSAMKPSSFRGARTSAASSATSDDKKDEHKTETSSEAKKGATKKGFFGIF